MIAAAALILTLQSGPAPAPELLAAFKAACARTDDLGAMEADARASGWEPLSEGTEPRIDKLNRLGREASAEGTIAGASFRRKVGEREVFLIVSRYEDGSGFWGNGCRVYDFAATAPVEAAALEAWMGREPTGVEDLGSGLGRRLWEPGWRDGLTVEISHVPAGHPMAAAFGIEGNIFIAQAIRGF